MDELDTPAPASPAGILSTPAPRFRGDIAWVRLPRWVGRRVPALGLALAEGSWLRAWPWAGVLSPLVAVAAGALIGALRPDPAYLSNLAVLVVLAAVAGAGAGVGSWVWVGYVAADLAANPPAGTTLAEALVPKLIAAGMLAVALVVLPLSVTGLRVLLVRRVQDREAVAGVLAVALQAVLAGAGFASWVLAAAVLSRPLWTWIGASPAAGVLTTMRDNAVVLGVIAAGSAGTCRILASRVEDTTASPPEPPDDAGRSFGPWWLSALAGAAVLTVALTGLIEGPTGTAIVGIVVLLACTVRGLVLPRLAAWQAVVARVPLLARLAAVGALAWWLSGFVTVPAVERGEPSFAPLLAAIVVPIVVAALVMLPPAPGGGEGDGAGTGDDGTRSDAAEEVPA